MAGRVLVLTAVVLLASSVLATNLRAHDPAEEVKAALSQLLAGQSKQVPVSLVKGDPPQALSPAASRDELHDLIADITRKNQQISDLKSSIGGSSSSSSSSGAASAARAADDAAAAKFAAEKADKAGLNPKIDYLSLPGVVTVKDDAKPINAATTMAALLGAAAPPAPVVVSSPASEVLVAPPCGGSLPGSTPCDKLPVVTVQGETMQWQANGPNAGEPVTSQPTIESKIHMVDHLADLPSMPRPRDTPFPANYGPNATFHVFEKAAKDAKCDCNCGGSGGGGGGGASGAGSWLPRHELDMALSVNTNGISLEDVFVARKDAAMIEKTIAEFKQAEERLRAKRAKLEEALRQEQGKVGTAPPQPPPPSPASEAKQQFDGVFGGNAVPDLEKTKLKDEAKAKAEKDPEAMKKAAEADKAVAEAQEKAKVAAAKEVADRVAAEAKKSPPPAPATPAGNATAAQALLSPEEPVKKKDDKDAAKKAEELLEKAKEEQKEAREQIKKSEAFTQAAVKNITDSTMQQIKDIVDQKGK
jgi:hypothetical protein